MQLRPGLTDPQVAALARQAVDLLSTDITIRIAPSDEGNIHRSGAVRWWFVRLSAQGVRGFAIRIDGSMSPAAALAHLLTQLSVYRSGSEPFRGIAFPPCPGHAHDASVTVADDGVVLICPTSGDVADRIEPVANR